LAWRGQAEPAQAEAAMSAMLDLPDPPTAVFAAQNLVAVGVLAALRHRGAAHRVAVIGFDDLELAELLDPPLTVVAQDPEAIGRISAEGVFAGLAGSPMTKDVVLPVRLVIRGSGEIPGPFA
jgi:LacI family transcriptional regulator